MAPQCQRIAHNIEGRVVIESMSCSSLPLRILTKASYHGAAPPSRFSRPLSNPKAPCFKVPAPQLSDAHAYLNVRAQHASSSSMVAACTWHALIHNRALIRCDTTGMVTIWPPLSKWGEMAVYSAIPPPPSF